MVIRCAVSLVAIAGSLLIPTAAAAAHPSPSPGALAREAAVTADPVAIRVSRMPARVQVDGGIDVVIWTRCAAGLTAFELGVSITQDGQFGTFHQLSRDVVLCDGARHRSEVTVYSEGESFTRGFARIDAYLAANDPMRSDIEATDTAGVYVRKAWQPAVVHIAERGAPITAGGGVRIVLWSRCQPWFQAFELNLGVDQSDVGGFIFEQAPPAVVVCDGTLHKSVRTVHPTDGSFAPGPAEVGVYLGFYDTRQGRDLEATDVGTVRLYRRSAS